MYQLKLAFRNLFRNRLYTSINIIGLSIGLAAIILIYKIVSHELAYNKNFTQYDKIVRVIREINNPESGIDYNPGNPQPAMVVLKENIPQFEKTVRIKETWPMISVPDPKGGSALKKFEMDPGEIAFLVEPSFFDIFNVRWIAGDKKNALKTINKVVLSKSTAMKCFGTTENIIGRYISTDNQQPFLQIEGIVEDMVSTCDFPVKAFISYETATVHPSVYNVNNDWGSNSSNDQFFALLRPSTTLENVNSALATVGKEEYKNKRVKVKHIAQPLSDLHFNEDVGHPGTHSISKKKLQILGFIGFLILIMACFNFINMANAQSVTRAKEVGIRKTLGVQYRTLMSSFMLETGLLVFVSLIIGGLLAFLLTPLLHHISPLPENIAFFDGWRIVLFLFSILLVVTFLAGFYPGTVLSSFKPMQIFRSGFEKNIGSGVSLRKLLMLFQFVIAFGLIVSTIIAMSQMHYIRNMKLGFNKDLVYTFGLNNDSATISNLHTFKNELLRIPGIEKVSFSSDRPSSDNTWSSNWRFGSSTEDAPFSIAMKFCDADYRDAYDLKMLTGRWLMPSDTVKEVVLNKTALLKLGITDYESAIGQPVIVGSRRHGTLVGVVDDYHAYSAHQPIVPLLMTTRKDVYYVTSVRLRPQNISTTISGIDKTFNKIFPDYVFRGRFYDEMIQRFYESDSEYYALCKGFAILAIIISCLGLFALASFSISRKVKEIGIRKVLGASSLNIVGLVSKEFIMLVTISILIASPLAWYFMSKWLDDFVYRTTISWWMFAIAILLVLILTFVTVSTQAIKAAIANPVKSLRSE